LKKNNEDLLKNLIEIKSFLKEKFDEQPTLEWMEISAYDDDPNYPDVLCKFAQQKDIDDFDVLTDELFIWMDYLNNDLAGYLHGYENICEFSVSCIKRSDFNS
jgi:hypothetical protein